VASTIFDEVIPGTLTWAVLWPLGTVTVPLCANLALPCTFRARPCALAAQRDPVQAGRENGVAVLRLAEHAVPASLRTRVDAGDTALAGGRSLADDAGLVRGNAKDAVAVDRVPVDAVPPVPELVSEPR
jgi:hypothetical protein